MDIQIPALEWVPQNRYSYKTVYTVDRKHIEVNLAQKGKKSLTFSWEDMLDDINNRIIQKIKNTFVFFMDEIEVGNNPNLKRLQNYYSDVCYMRTDPFNALLVTILSQNKTAEMTRNSFFNLLQIVKELTAPSIMRVNERVLKEAIRIAGPYKTKYIIRCAREICNHWGGDMWPLVKKPTDEALSILMSLPGVGHKTAACVLVYSALKKDILPIDTHLWMVVRRLCLVNHIDNNLTSSTQNQILTQLRCQIPDMGFAHLFFVALGREFCSARNPKCRECPLNLTCPTKGL